MSNNMSGGINNLNTTLAKLNVPAPGTLTIQGVGGTNNENEIWDYESEANAKVITTTSGLREVKYKLNPGGDYCYFDYDTYSTGGNSILRLRRSKNNTVGTDTATSDTNVLGGIQFAGNNGGGFFTAAEMLGYQDGAIATYPPGGVRFRTITTAGGYQVNLDLRNSGAVQMQCAATTGGLQVVKAEATGTATAANSFSIAVNVPVSCLIIGAQLRVDTALSSSDGGTAWSAAYATGSTQAICSAQAFTKSTKVNKFFDANAATPITSDTTTITVTCDSAKTFIAGGVVRAIVYYQTWATMADAS